MTVGRQPDVVERILAAVERLRARGPLWAAHRLTTAAALALMTALGLILGSGIPWFSPWRHALAVLFTFGSYRVFLKVRQVVWGTRNKALLVDSLLCLTPCYMLASVALGQATRPAMDLLGISLPAAAAVLRLGCFLNGCCFGLPCRLGVVYPPAVLKRLAHSGTLPKALRYPTPVLPLQCVEAGFHAGLAYTLARHCGSMSVHDGRALPIYFLCYGIFRFFLEFLRYHRFSIRRGILSTAQWTALPAVLASLLVWRALAP